MKTTTETATGSARRTSHSTFRLSCEPASSFLRACAAFLLLSPPPVAAIRVRSANVPFAQNRSDSVGTGASAAAGKTITVSYTGWLYDASKTDQKGQQFDSSAGYTFALGVGAVIPGWDQGCAGHEGRRPQTARDSTESGVWSAGRAARDSAQRHAGVRGRAVGRAVTRTPRSPMRMPTLFMLGLLLAVTAHDASAERHWQTGTWRQADVKEKCSTSVPGHRASMAGARRPCAPWRCGPFEIEAEGVLIEPEDVVPVGRRSIDADHRLARRLRAREEGRLREGPRRQGTQTPRDKENGHPVMSMMPTIFVAHGSPLLLDDAEWVRELNQWAHAMPRPESVLMLSAPLGRAACDARCDAHGSAGLRFLRVSQEILRRRICRAGGTGTGRARSRAGWRHTTGRRRPGERPRPRRVRPADRDVSRSRRPGAADVASVS